MTFYDIIEKKRDKGELTKQEINYFVEQYVADNIPDYQAAALIMAIFLNGMTDAETVNLTLAMRDSGKILDLSCFGGNVVDKHSTGGVGDKTTLIVAPIVAALGGKVAKMSGRGLGFTGGTADKLESIKGYNTQMSIEDFINQVEKIGVAVIENVGGFVPADKKIYALRDVTATVNSQPLIASSVMSKKLASGADAIVLDVKVGSGAFTDTIEKATELAEKMIKIGYDCSKKVVALITDMDIPLGKTIGNRIEVAEAVQILKGKGDSRLFEICIALAANMLSLSNNWSMTYALSRAQTAISDGSAYKKFLEWITAQGGDVTVFDDLDDFVKSEYVYEVYAETQGYISKIDAGMLGKVSVSIGAGRKEKGDSIDFSAGVYLPLTLGDKVNKGDMIARLYSSSVNDLKDTAEKVKEAIQISETPPEKNKVIYKIIQR